MLAPSQPTSKIQAPVSSPPAAPGNNSDLPTSCDVKLICRPRKKSNKRHVYLTFVESRSVSTPDEQPCLEIVGKKSSSSILFNDCISFEYFETIKNDFQSFIYIYLQSYTVSIYFSDEQLSSKALIVKQLESMCRNAREGTPTQSTLSTTEHIVHTFDTKLIPYQSIVTREHELIGPIRLYFTSTDLYIASIQTSHLDLRATIVSQCPSKEKLIMCIPYFTIKHYGNRARIFLLELGKSNYGDGEIRMKCQSSELASTIHLLASPIIEERPLVLSSAFSNQFLTHKRIEKSKHIHPPIRVNHEGPNEPAIGASIVSLDEAPAGLKPTPLKSSRSFSDAYRKLVKYVSPLHRSLTSDTNQKCVLQLSNDPLEESIEERHLLMYQPRPTPAECPPPDISTSNSHTASPILSFNQAEATMGSYLEMGPVVEKVDCHHSPEIPIERTAATADVGTNTTISLSPHVRSAIIVGNTVHLIAEEKSVFSIGQRSLTSPASVLQPFKSQLHGQPLVNTHTTPLDMPAYTPSSSSSNSRQSLLLSYGVITFNSGSNLNGMSSDLLDPCSSLNLDGSVREHRLNSDFSLMSLSHQQQPANIYPFDSVLSSASSGSQIFRTLSVSTNNTGDNSPGSILTSNGSIIFFDERYSDQSTNYLLGPPMTLTDHVHRRASTSHSHVSEISKETLPANDSYALVQPLSNPSKTKPTLSEVNYTDVLSSLSSQSETSPADERGGQVVPANDQSMTLFYADIDHHQTQLCQRRAQLATMSNVPDRAPPFIL